MKMTKFEDKLEKLPIKTIQHPFGDTEYYKAVHIKTLIAQADEEFQELKEQHGNQAESILLMLEEISTLKSQLQQQALPVVPECVAEWIEILKTKGLKPLKNPETYGETGFTEEKLQNIVFWISEHQEDYMRAWLDGYTVEKPQLFYLRDELTGQFLAKDNQFKNEDRYFFWTGADPLTHSIGTAWKLTFTQQEIDSMQTGSYEQIEVAE
ncbi:DUF1642 domain-containing protein [Lactococcus cremoris]|uniref:DUF1642 domain-containing protein n=1 Tax=Lactococcus lactis subsp. cremoris TaxID=1359 RepID=UPI000583FAB7|nr:hypothetical protein JL36_04270 [Lactococcus cremoris]QSE64086.1 DUF1642 domain-containing protein [Lactococcus cremoris]